MRRSDADSANRLALSQSLRNTFHTAHERRASADAQMPTSVRDAILPGRETRAGLALELTAAPADTFKRSSIEAVDLESTMRFGSLSRAPLQAQLAKLDRHRGSFAEGSLDLSHGKRRRRRRCEG